MIVRPAGLTFVMTTEYLMEVCQTQTLQTGIQEASVSHIINTTKINHRALLVAINSPVSEEFVHTINTVFQGKNFLVVWKS